MSIKNPILLVRLSTTYEDLVFFTDVYVIKKLIKHVTKTEEHMFNNFHWIQLEYDGRFEIKPGYKMIDNYFENITDNEFKKIYQDKIANRISIYISITPLLIIKHINHETIEINKRVDITDISDELLNEIHIEFLRHDSWFRNKKIIIDETIHPKLKNLLKQIFKK